MSANGELSAEEIVRLNREYTLFSLSVQNQATPIPVSHGEGVYFWDANGKRYLDFSSQLMNLNIGHGNKKVIRAIQEQAERLAFVQPSFATDVRGIAARKIAEVTPGRLKKTFFTLGGAEAVENAMKIARLYTGRQKIITRYRAYHGGTFATGSAGGDPRGIPNEPGVPWVRRVQDPYRYRCVFCRDLPQCNLMCEMHIEETIRLEGPQTVAAVLLEG
ncbi:MAG TPA: aminotransferase class III-fold pyridoxal phosphate-dependent enzyme, partial [Ardenticatenaceae bacterium]|nr:aminotransferase class III-fold pyridoxal phosphate-dependent enzyme [Ardenticatenaceae bacterium]